MAVFSRFFGFLSGAGRRRAAPSDPSPAPPNPSPSAPAPSYSYTVRDPDRKVSDFSMVIDDETRALLASESWARPLFSPVGWLLECDVFEKNVGGLAARLEHFTVEEIIQCKGKDDSLGHESAHARVTYNDPGNAGGSGEFYIKWHRRVNSGHGAIPFSSAGTANHKLTLYFTDLYDASDEVYTSKEFRGKDIIRHLTFPKGGAPTLMDVAAVLECHSRALPQYNLRLSGCYWFCGSTLDALKNLFGGTFTNGDYASFLNQPGHFLALPIYRPEAWTPEDQQAEDEAVLVMENRMLRKLWRQLKKDKSKRVKEPAALTADDVQKGKNDLPAREHIIESCRRRIEKVRRDFHLPEEPVMVR